MSRLSLRTADGVALAGRIRAVDNPRAAVVVVHGFTATQDHPEVLAVADALVAHGFDVVTYDGRGHGSSEGICTLGHHERADVAAAVAVARGERDEGHACSNDGDGVANAHVAAV